MNLYHYCSQEAFLSIISEKSFRCSALSLSNDTMEGKWIRKIFSDICDKDNMKQRDRDFLIKIWEHWFSFYEALGFCMSEHGDSLSQWRGYAQNAEGFCIGFSKERLQWQRTNMRGLNEPKKRSFDLIKVEYDIARQREELEPTYQKIKKLIDEGAFDTTSIGPLADILFPSTQMEEEFINNDIEKLQTEIIAQIDDILPKFFQLKNPAFKEEKEWRAVAGFSKAVDRDNIEFRSVGDCIVPYRSFKFEPGIIAEIILGPKNQTPVDIIEVVLEKFGYIGWAAEGVMVKKSEASYR